MGPSRCLSKSLLGIVQRSVESGLLVLTEELIEKFIDIPTNLKSKNMNSRQRVALLLFVLRAAATLAAVGRGPRGCWTAAAAFPPLRTPEASGQALLFFWPPQTKLEEGALNFQT